MQYLEMTLDTPAANLALDEALLNRAEKAEKGDGSLFSEVTGSASDLEVLRLWESPEPFVVVGRSSQVEDEVDCEACRRGGIPILRRSSGGAAIVTGPGCLMYAVVLGYERRPQLRMIDQAHQFVLTALAEAIGRMVDGVKPRGTSDLAISQESAESPFLKFSGNSLRCRRTHLLYHGTLLYDFPLELISECLRQPPRRPDYRADRPHDRFVTNLSVSAADLRTVIRNAFHATDDLIDCPESETDRLVIEKYSQDAWNLAR